MSFSFDAGQVFTTHGPGELQQETNKDNERIRKQWYEFLKEYRQDAEYIYRNQLKANLLVPNYSVTVNLRHVQIAKPELADELVRAAQDLMPQVEQAAHRLAKELMAERRDENDTLDTLDIPEIQVLIESDASMISMRDINSNYINRMVRICGIVSSASMPSARAIELHMFCRSCRHTKAVKISKGFTGFQMPRTCESTGMSDDKKCPLDPYLIDHDKTKYIDQQVLKLQEAPDNVPVGELPRHMLLTVDRYLVNRAAPGSRVTVHGVYDIFQKNSKAGDAHAGLRNPYMRVLGLEIDLNATRRGKNTFSPEEEARYIELSRRADIYETFAKSIAPSIYGNDDIKKSITCLLVGGSKKILPDGLRLRGDINVLLLGDPGTAKSQLLKFVEKVAPVSVYTSGKGSSAAGLTASVVRDANTREFYLEGGAMVLADGGVVCIDEFDKMREDDRVAIHEAMEQQTISIAKAGITTILNSRTAVLAAANPIFGRYDDMKTPGENIDFQSTILSRFDMIYILRDEHNKERDESLARHVMNVHTTMATSQEEGELDLETMRGYICYCKSRCSPRLMPEAREKLASHFVDIRSQVKKMEAETHARSSVPITIRQLEAIIRISEALAKLQLSPNVGEQHVDEAIRLFRVSTYNATRSGHVLGEGMMMANAKKDVLRAQDEVKRRLPLGARMPESALIEHLTNKGLKQFAIDRALSLMRARGSIQYMHQGKTIMRIPGNE